MATKAEDMTEKGRIWEGSIGRRVGVSLLTKLEKADSQCCF